jgi:hypothetical protein
MFKMSQRFVQFQPCLFWEKLDDFPDTAIGRLPKGNLRLPRNISQTSVETRYAKKNCVAGVYLAIYYLATARLLRPSRQAV